MIFSLWTPIFLGTLFSLLYLYFTRNFNYWKKRNIPYVKPIPFFGNLLPVCRMELLLGQWLQDLCEKIKKDYFGIFMFDQPVLVVTEPKIIKSILLKDFNTFDARSPAHAENDPIMDNIMFFTKNPKWKAVRSKLSPIFTSGKLKNMFPYILNEGKEMAKYLSPIANIPDVESKEICAKYSTNVIAKCAFAIDARSFENPDAEFRTIGRSLFEFSLVNTLRQMGPWLAPGIIKFFQIRFFNSNSLDRLSDIFKDVLHQRMALQVHKGHDLVDTMLEEKKKNRDSHFNDENILVGQAIQFFVAGFETVAGTLSFTLYELCIAPEIQEKLRQEIFESMEANDGHLTYESIMDMKYLDMCVSESLRKYPVIPFLDRKCKSTYKVEDFDLVIEKGTPVYFPLWSLHYNKKYFPDPEKYEPERFADKSQINVDGLYYLPFGDGPRVCIGTRFGLLSVKTGLISILTKFRLERTEKTPVPMKFELKSLLLQSTVGVPLKFVPL